jgi:hypothetical protein
MKKISLIIFLAFIGCNSNSLLKNELNEHQSILLEELLIINDSILRNHVVKNENIEINKLYFSYLQIKNTQNDLSTLSDNLFCSDKNLLEDLFENELLTKSNTKSYKPEGIVVEYDFNLQGVYRNYLYSVSKDSNFASRYLKELVTAGGLSPTLTKLLVSTITKDDLKNENVRLIVGLHFLLLNQAE